MLLDLRSLIESAGPGSTTTTVYPIAIGTSFSAGSLSLIRVISQSSTVFGTIGTASAVRVLSASAGVTQFAAGQSQFATSISCSGIISTFQTGTASFSNRISLSGITTTQSFGIVNSTRVLSASAVITVFGSGFFSASHVLSCSGAPAAEIFGIASASTNIFPVWSGTGETFGTATVLSSAGNTSVYPSGIISSETIGSILVSTRLGESGSSFGIISNPSLSAFISGSGISTTYAVGNLSTSIKTYTSGVTSTFAAPGANVTFTIAETGSAFGERGTPSVLRIISASSTQTAFSAGNISTSHAIYANSVSSSFQTSLETVATNIVVQNSITGTALGTAGISSNIFIGTISGSGLFGTSSIVQTISVSSADTVFSSVSSSVATKIFFDSTTSTESFSEPTVVSSGQIFPTGFYGGTFGIHGVKNVISPSSLLTQEQFGTGVFSESSSVIDYDSLSQEQVENLIKLIDSSPEGQEIFRQLSIRGWIITPVRRRMGTSNLSDETHSISVQIESVNKRKMRGIANSATIIGDGIFRCKAYFLELKQYQTPKIDVKLISRSTGSTQIFIERNS